MKMFKAFLSTILLLLILSFTNTRQDWQQVVPEGGNCSIAMPGNPKRIDKTINNRSYGELIAKIWAFQPEKGTDLNLAYMVSYTDYPEGTIHSDSVNILKDFYNSFIDGTINNVQGKLLSETIINLSGYPGREVRVDFKNGLALIRYRYFLVKRRLYMLQIIPLTENNFNTSINKFLDSFALLEK
jgi:hypothetical protein